jgi:hypothetical protein
LRLPPCCSDGLPWELGVGHWALSSSV